MEDLIKELKKVMKEKDFSPEKASKYLGCSAKQIRRWLTDKATPTYVYQNLIRKGINKIKRL